MHGLFMTCGFNSFILGMLESKINVDAENLIKTNKWMNLHPRRSSRFVLSFRLKIRSKTNYLVF